MIRHLLVGLFAIGIAAAAFADCGCEQHLEHLVAAPLPALPYDMPRSMRNRLALGIRCKAILEIDYHSGTVKDLKIQESTGSPSLDQTVINTLHRWKFEPDTTMHIEVPICFSLRGAIIAP
jgi:TonB family protein